MVKKKEYARNILQPEIKEYQDLQVFEFKGKDARGYDCAVQLSPIEALSLMKDVPQAVDADRVKVYFGGDPENMKNIGTEIEISIGEEPEVYKIDSAFVTYVPKGLPYQNRVTKKPDKLSWLVTYTLPPKYVEPDESKE
jgi:hypothetical protein